ncbi:hypothetical protein ACKWTF_009500 [Chironomus riparius]
MEQNSSSVCVATIHKDDQKSTKLLDDAMPLYATIIPANTRRARLQQQQLQQKQQQQQEQTATTKQTFQQQQSQTICSSNHKMSNENRKLSSENKKLNENGNDNNYDSTSGESDGEESVELWSNEIPVYVKGEQRWISGVTDQTTCLDIIEALLMDEGILKSTNDSNNNTNGGNLYPPKVNDYVITERWRRMEQALDGRTKILKIWTAWGTEQSEVRFCLKRRSDSHHSSNQQQQQQQHQSQSQTQTTGGGVAILAGDRDSGRGSPTGSINSAIVRRRRHRASKSTFAWMTHGQTIHPKSSKNNIERLMKLILEQGEVIQQQLSKLRDRELEISTLEEERHKIREKEHGKNYLLETYLKGISNDNDDKQELAAGNSDSGVHTEETAASPEVQHEDEISDTLIPLNEQNLSSVKVSSKKHRRSKREHELMLEHQSTKEYSSAISSEKKSIVENEQQVQEELKMMRNDDEMPMSSEVAAQIDILEKLIVLNKHLQREEELCVRLSAKIKRYEADASGLSEAQVKESLGRVNEQLDAKNCEIAQMESEIKMSDDALNSKTDVLKKLYDDLEEAEVEHRKLDVSNDVIDGATALMPPELPPLKSEQFKMLTQNEELNMSREYLAENIYNISKIILKSSGQSMPLNMNNINQNSIDFSRHMTDTLSSNSAVQQMPMLNQQIYQMPQHTMPSTAEKRIIQAQIHSIPTHQLTNNTITDISQFKSTLPQHHQQQQHKYNEAMRASMSYLATINQRIQKNNHHIESDINNVNNPIIQATQYKLGPKKLLINTQAINGSSSCSNNSNSIIESRNNIYKRNMILQPNDCINLTTQQDVSQLGTLV